MNIDMQVKNQSPQIEPKKKLKSSSLTFNMIQPESISLT